jgi:hypothetical protein
MRAAFPIVGRIQFHCFVSCLPATGLALDTTTTRNGTIIALNIGNAEICRITSRSRVQAERYAFPPFPANAGLR